MWRCLVVAAFKIVMVTFLARLRLLQFDQAPSAYPSIVHGLDILFVRYLWDNKLFSLCLCIRWTKHNKCHFLLLNLDNDRYGPKENFAKICQIK